LVSQTSVMSAPVVFPWPDYQAYTALQQGKLCVAPVPIHNLSASSRQTDGDQGGNRRQR
jgi:hypothetical protein